MSIEIDWDALTTGTEGAELAESIRVFIHEKFQEVDLPKFIRSVEVHNFEFGDSCPSIVIKDVCDPLPDFYEDGDDDQDGEEALQSGESLAAGTGVGENQYLPAPQMSATVASSSLLDRREPDKTLQLDTSSQIRHAQDPNALPTNPLRLPLPPLQSTGSLADQLASPILSRSSTPRIPGGTSSMSYFHLPLAGRIQGTGAQSPLSAVAGWQAHQAELHAQRMGDHIHPHQLSQHEEASQRSRRGRLGSPMQSGFPDPDPSTRPSTAHSHDPSQNPGLRGISDYPSPRTPSPAPEPDPNDLQIVLHISYSGNVRLSLTAEILLDYPMPSFVGIPLKLNITGLSFDGVALLALLQSVGRKAEPEENGDRRAHFCFLAQEDAETLVGAENALDPDPNIVNSTGPAGRQESQGGKLGSLLREIRVESEIGKTKDGRQNLKNVGKVEKFVLEQVRRIFEDEFVYPSFWTFLV
jgi:mitochondrial distribution and morphology protein 12